MVMNRRFYSVTTFECIFFWNTGEKSVASWPRALQHANRTLGWASLAYGRHAITMFCNPDSMAFLQPSALADMAISPA